ncbi:MAG: ABC transporter permease [Armatimonadetes bacterium]|nr:ABC transporter permease [Armatimonadota bacterium]
MVDFLLQTVTMSAPLILMAMAGYMSERSGVINIGLEGKMLTACFVCAAFAPRFGAIGGVALAIVAGIIISLLHWTLTQVYRIDHIISGMAINLLASGGTAFLVGSGIGKDILSDAQRLPLPLYYGLAIVSPIVLYAVANRTRFGLRHKSVGSDPDKARLLGINPQTVRFGALICTGIFSGIAGSLLVTETSAFTKDMTSGRGYIALAALILGGWRPIPAALSCLLFGFATAVQIQMSGKPLFGMEIPSEIWKMLPYIVTLLALAGLLGRNRTPAGLGKH